MSLRWALQEHAVERYIERHAPDLDAKAARRELLTGLIDAHQMKERTPCGDAMWVVPSLDIRVVTRPQPEGGVWPVLTVLPARGNNELTEREREMVAERAEMPQWMEDALGVRRAPPTSRGRVAPRPPAPTYEERRLDAIVVKESAKDAKRRQRAEAHARLLAEHAASKTEKRTKAQQRAWHEAKEQQEKFERQAALRLAVRFLLARRDDPEAVATLERMARVTPWVTKPEFYERHDQMIDPPMAVGDLR